MQQSIRPSYQTGAVSCDGKMTGSLLTEIKWLLGAKLTTGWRPCFVHFLFTTNLVTCHAIEINKAHLAARRRRAS